MKDPVRGFRPLSVCIQGTARNPGLEVKGPSDFTGDVATVGSGRSPVVEVQHRLPASELLFCSVLDSQRVKGCVVHGPATGQTRVLDFRGAGESMWLWSMLICYIPVLYLADFFF